MRIVLLGFGAVARRMLEMLGPRRQELPGLDALQVQIAGIFTGSHGFRIPSHPESVSEVLKAKARGDLLRTDREADLERFIAQEEYDVLVELTTLSVEREGLPAVDYVRWALESGRHVVTANKGPLAFQGSALSKLARRRGSLLRFESTVMDGAPVFSLSRCGLRGCRVLSFEGILNSTTQFIISQVEQGRSFRRALLEAQRQGFAEADPALDLQGWDAACKIAVLANSLMDADLHPFSVVRQELLPDMAPEVRRAYQEGRRLRMVCRARRRGGRVEGQVALQRLSPQDRLARVKGAGSVLRLFTDAMGPLLIEQESPTLDDTAYGVLNDLLEIASKVGS